MRIGITGHQRRTEIDWHWFSRTVGEEIGRRSVTNALTSLAIGADTEFAQQAMTRGVPVTAVIPFASYESCFVGHDRRTYLKLLQRCAVVQLNGKNNVEESFAEAGRYIVAHCDLLFALWDGKPSQGVGGTADIVDFAKKKRRPVLHFDPNQQQVRLLDDGP